MNEISIYPGFNARYYSFYVLGLISMVGASRITYTRRGFPRFGPDCLALRVRGRSERKIYIHSNDHPELDEQGLAWCDVFGKVNLERSLVPERHRSKVLAIGPTFAVRVWSPIEAELLGLRNFVRCPSGCAPIRQHLANYRGQYASRFPESTYAPSASIPDYVFYNAALWEREPEANALRARFVDACRSLRTIRFEGGLTPRNSARGDRGYAAPEYQRFICRRYTAAEYLEKTRQSAVVLNNPAYRDCHSWRLAEYLALGKAIISTPIVRALPAPLVHGVHLHYVDGTVESFRSAISQICNDDRYRQQLERNARAYYEEYLSPARVMTRLLDKAAATSTHPRKLDRQVVPGITIASQSNPIGA